MKAVIVEIKGNVAAVLSEDGIVSKVRNKDYFIGQEIKLKNNNKYIKLAASAAAALVIFVTPAWAYLTPYSYVSLDINPSFEFSINMFDRVLEAKGVNGDGEKVIEKISIAKLKNKEINEAVKSVLVELKDQGYIIEGQEGGVVVAASSKNNEKTDKLAASLKTAVEEEVEFKTEKDNKIKQNIKEKPEVKVEIETEEVEKAEEIEETKVKEEPTVKEDKEVAKEDKKVEKEAAKAQKENEKEAKFAVEVIEVSQNDVDEAKEHNATPGKYNLVRKLEESEGHTFDAEEIEYWLNQPIQKIMEAIKENNVQEKEESKEVNKQENLKKEAAETRDSENKSSNKGSKN